MDNIVLLFLSLGILNGLSPIFTGVEVILLMNAKRSIDVMWFVVGALLMNLIGAEIFYSCAFYFLNVLLAKMHTIGPQIRLIADLLIGAVLIVFAVAKAIKRGKRQEDRQVEVKKTSKKWAFFVDGLALQFVLFPFSLLLFVFITKLAYTHPNFWEGALIVLAFCILASVPLALVILLFGKYRKAIERFVRKLKVWEMRINNTVVPLICGGAGLYLVIDAAFKW